MASRLGLGWVPSLLLLSTPVHSYLVSTPRPHAFHAASGAACSVRMAADPEEPGGGRKRRGILWSRVRNRVREVDEHAPIGESVDVITKEIDEVLAARRKRLNVKLKTSLKRFRTEVTSEVELQANETKERQARLKERQTLIVTSLSGLRDDILDEIEATVTGQRAVGKVLDASLRGLREYWEKEVNVLIDGAKTDVDLAVIDIEDVLKEQREEWQRSVEVFEDQWITQGTARFRRNATGADGKPNLKPVFFAQRAEVGATHFLHTCYLRATYLLCGSYVLLCTVHRWELCINYVPAIERRWELASRRSRRTYYVLTMHSLQVGARFPEIQTYFMCTYYALTTGGSSLPGDPDDHHGGLGGD